LVKRGVRCCSGTAKFVRCFVALWPDGRAAQQLSAVARTLCRDAPAARIVAAADLHLTLAFIGELDGKIAVDLAGNVQRAIVEPVPWVIDRVGSFPRARVLWAAGAERPRLAETAAGVRRLLSQLGVPFDAKAFVPHITLARAYRSVGEQPGLSSIEPIQCHLSAPRLARSLPERGSPRYGFVGPLD
jgi:2'-5' RNA ligase